jgi:hypothetical protein
MIFGTSQIVENVFDIILEFELSNRKLAIYPKILSEKMFYIKTFISIIIIIKICK